MANFLFSFSFFNCRQYSISLIFLFFAFLILINFIVKIQMLTIKVTTLVMIGGSPAKIPLLIAVWLTTPLLSIFINGLAIDIPPIQNQKIDETNAKIKNHLLKPLVSFVIKVFIHCGMKQAIVVIAPKIPIVN